MCAHICVGPIEARRGLQIHGAGGIGVGELPNIIAGIQMRIPLMKQQALLAPESSPLFSFLFLFLFLL